MEPTETESRKADHVRIVLEEDVTFRRTTTDLEAYRLVHCALPEVDLDEVRTETHFLGHRLAFPLVIASMTGGTPETGRLNRMLAEAAQASGIGMGLGSGRVMLEQPEVAGSFQVRDVAPDILLFANLGAVQLNYGYGVEACRRLLDLTQADALYLHLNPLQEALQLEGDTRFSGLLSQIGRVCRALEVPVIVKEVGWGLSTRVARQLIEAGVAALDVAGSGGTSWSQVEFYRHGSRAEQEIASSFREWGIPTALSLGMVREADPDIPLVASGGVQSGIDIAKCLALGADITTMAGPLLRAVATSGEALAERLDILHRQFRIAMFASGSPDVAALRTAEIIHS
jgi:isopentenyl-diphosphate Delta-isomerase